MLGNNLSHALLTAYGQVETPSRQPASWATFLSRSMGSIVDQPSNSADEARVGYVFRFVRHESEI